ncbi:MAG TPA: class I SAM-dependent methyltransferase [Bryobacteraceae bacterium]|nr:class I SAM-dependent methyltransferase [Bryobacteraceae bacterium]
MRDTMPQVIEFWNDAAREFDAIYSGAGKSRWARFLDRLFRNDIYQRFHWVMQKSGDVAGQTICDIGCGSGRFVTEFAQRGATRVTGIDVAPEMLKLARGLVERGGVERRCDFVLSDILDWNTNRVFDITIAIGLWDYIAAPHQRLVAIRKITSGTFLSAWPRFWTWRMPVRKLRLQYILGCPVYFFRESQVRRLLEQAGFEVVSFDTVGKLFCVEARPRRGSDVQ